MIVCRLQSVINVLPWPEWLMAKMPRCPDVRMFRCSNVQMSRCLAVPVDVATMAGKPYSLELDVVEITGQNWNLESRCSFQLPYRLLG